MALRLTAQELLYLQNLVHYKLYGYGNWCMLYNNLLSNKDVNFARNLTELIQDDNLQLVNNMLLRRGPGGLQPDADGMFTVDIPTEEEEALKDFRKNLSELPGLISEAKQLFSY